MTKLGKQAVSNMMEKKALSPKTVLKAMQSRLEEVAKKKKIRDKAVRKYHNTTFNDPIKMDNFRAGVKKKDDAYWAAQNKTEDQLENIRNIAGDKSKEIA